MLRYCRSIGYGFSLVELMVVVTVIGILIALILPRFYVFIARGRQSEAIHNVGQIRALQKSYNLRYQGLGRDDEWYETLSIGNGGTNPSCSQSALNNELGFRVPDCLRLRYTYNTHMMVIDASNYATGTHKIYPNSDNEILGICAIAKLPASLVIVW